MSCSVAIASSPAFSPSRISISCKASPEALTLNPSSPSSSCSSSSPFRSRFQRAASGLRASNAGFGSAATSSSGVCVDSSNSPPPPGSAASGSVLKRKRPARIDIPLVESLAFSAEGSNDAREVEAESARYSVYCKRGRKRLEMEDRHKVSLDLNGDSKLAFFGIFDGHGGKRAAEFASENLADFIAEEISTTIGGSSNVEEAIRIAYLKTDAEFLKEEANGGACCVTALVRDGNVVVSNAGDCRAVLSRAGKAEALTSDHRPSREDERDRIESLGGYVDFFRGTWRLQGSLAISRGIGDSHLKQWVIPEPETKVVNIEDECEFLILASDGLWDKVGNQEAVDIARPLCLGAAGASSPLSACKKLVDLSAARGSLDDISVMIVKLQHFV